MRDWLPSRAGSLRPCRHRLASRAAAATFVPGWPGVWLLLAPLACCGVPLLIAGLAAAGALAWGGIGLAVAVLLAAGVLVVRRRRRACLSAGAADPQPRVETSAPRSGTR